MDKTFEFYSQILDNVIESDVFWANYFLSPFSFEENVPCFPDEETEFFCGISRGALVSNTYNEVVKFELSSQNFCQNEYNIYRAAKEQGLGMCFAACRYIGTYVKHITIPVVYDLASMLWEDGDLKERIYNEGEEQNCTIYLPLYAYEKVQHYVYGSTRVSHDDEAMFHHSNSPLIEREYEIGAAIRHSYGDEVFWDLSNFCEEWQINDLHVGNVGWTMGTHKFVIMDYAGWHDEF